MDIFISYTESDKKWAEWIGQELARLGHTPHVHEWEISGGGNIMRWMEERMQKADRVLCVISPTYLTKCYSSLELESAAWAAASRRPNFMLPVIVQDCELPTLIGPIKRCDLFAAGGDDEKARAILDAFLVEAKPPAEMVAFPGGTKPPSAPSAVPQAIESLRTQSDLNPRVRDRVMKDRDKLDRLRDRIQLMSNLKDLHDILHDLQVQIYPQILDFVKVLDTDPVAPYGLAQILFQLQRDCERGREVAGRLPEDDEDRDAPWLKDVEQALPKLQSAADAKDPHAARDATSSFRLIIQRKQLTLDERLHALANSLPLDVLRKLLKDVCGMVPKGEDYDRLNRAQESLQLQETQLNAMVEEHHAWQDLESTFQLADQSTEKNLIESFRALWPDLRDSVRDIAQSYPTAQWAKQSSDLTNIIEVAAVQGNIEQLRQFFRLFRRNSLLHFWELDKNLKNKCEEISENREPLDQLLKFTAP